MSTHDLLVLSALTHTCFGVAVVAVVAVVVVVAVAVEVEVEVVAAAVVVLVEAVAGVLVLVVAVALVVEAGVVEAVASNGVNPNAVRVSLGRQSDLASPNTTARRSILGIIDY